MLQSQRVSVDQWHFLSPIALESIHSDLASTDNIATAFSSFNYNIYIYAYIIYVHSSKDLGDCLASYFDPLHFLSLSFHFK